MLDDRGIDKQSSTTYQGSSLNHTSSPESRYYSKTRVDVTWMGKKAQRKLLKRLSSPEVGDAIVYTSNGWVVAQADEDATEQLSKRKWWVGNQRR